MARTVTRRINEQLEVVVTQEPPYGAEYDTAWEAWLAQGDESPEPAPEPGVTRFTLVTAASTDPTLEAPDVAKLLSALIDPFDEDQGFGDEAEEGAEEEEPA